PVLCRDTPPPSPSGPPATLPTPPFSIFSPPPPPTEIYTLSLHDALPISYRLPALPHGTHYCGYVVKQGPVRRAEEVRTSVKSRKRRYVFVSAGGGGDGDSLMRTYLRAVRLLGPRAVFETLMAVGVNAPPEIRRELEAEARGLPVRLVSHVDDSLSQLAAADLV